jgi:hypothetical protein
MAYFGHPEAHDNDAERATHAGLASLDAISKLTEQLGHPKFSAMIGFDSGAVVVSESAKEEETVVDGSPRRPSISG